MVLAAAITIAACAEPALPRQAPRTTTPGLEVAPVASPGETFQVQRGPVVEEFLYNGNVDVRERTIVSSPVGGIVVGDLPERGAVVEAGDELFAVAPTAEIRAAAAELEAALLARELGRGDPAEVAARVEAAEARAIELGLPVGEEATVPLPESVTVTAPVDGTVIALFRPEDGLIAAGQQVLDLGDPDELVVTVGVSEDEAATFEEGTEVAVATRDGRGDPVGGTVASVILPDEESVDDEATIVVEIDDDAFEYGTPVRVSIPGSSRNDVFWLPPEALRSHDGQYFVVIVDGSNRWRSDIEIGLATAERVEIASGVRAGQTVVGP